MSVYYNSYIKLGTDTDDKGRYKMDELMFLNTLRVILFR